MRWLTGRTRADDGLDPAVGIEAQHITISRLPPSSDFRLALLEEGGRVISSIDLERGDLHDIKRSITMAMAVKPNG
jgi:hypothetical protein